MKFAKYISIVALTVTSVAFSAKADVTVRSSIDSVTVEMGDRAMMHVEIISDKGDGGSVTGIPEKGTEHEGVEFLEINKENTDMPDGMILQKYDILFQAFEPRLVTMPRIGYAIGTDTTYSDILTLNVRPVELDSLTTINPVEGTVSLESKWFDIFPDWMLDYWYWIILGLLVAGLGVAVYFLYKKNGKTLLPHKKIIPPYEQAIIDLDALKSSNLIEKGHIKEYYTRLTDILRRYLSSRFGIYAPEMTSTQTITAISEHPEASKAKSDLKQLFRVADFVKFAKVLPLPDDNIRSYNVVREFVEETRPVEDDKDGGKDSPDTESDQTVNTTDTINKN